MNSNNKSLINIFSLAIVGLVFFTLMLISFPVANNIKIAESGESIKELPFKRPQGSSTTQTYNFDLNSNPYLPSFLNQTRLNLIADDCVESITVNGNLVDLSNIKRLDLCNSFNGIGVNLGGYLLQGKNETSVRVSNLGGEMGLNIRSSLLDPMFLVYLIAINICLYYIFKDLFDRLDLNPQLLLIFMGGVIIREFYMLYTGHTSREHDSMTSTGHVDYIKYVMTNWKLPSPESGWEYFQSGGYYIISAVLATIFSFIGLTSYYPLWQSLSLLSYFGVMIFGLLTFKETIKNNWVNLLCSALFIFWGGTIIHSTRITNDVLYYFFYSGSIYFLLKWYLSDIIKYLYYCGLFVAFSFAIKSNALLLLPIIFCTLIAKFSYTYIDRKKFFGTVNLPSFLNIIFKKYFGAIVCCIVFVAIGAGFGMSARIKLHLEQPEKYSWLIPNLAPDWGGLTIDNSAKSLTFFDMKAFLIEPFANPHDKNTSRDYFWNYFQKSSLFGEFGFRVLDDKNKIHTNLASIQALLYLVILLVFLVGIFSLRAKDLRFYFVILLDMIVSIAGLITYRTSSPCGCNQDFRFVLPVIISFIVIYSIGLRKFFSWNNMILKVIALLSALFFILISIIFFMIPSF
jgi:hypothetical protein